MIDADPASGLVKVGAGTVLADLNEELHRLGLAMENLGDIDRQTIAGAISTGTHGTGARLRNISAQVEAIELVLADGGVRELTADADPELLRAARVGVGALGAISAVTLRCVPAFTLHRVDTPRPLDEVLDAFDELADANDHFEFFVFPYARLRPDPRAQPHRRAAAPARPVRRLPQRRRAGELGAGGALGDRQRLPRAIPPLIPRSPPGSPPAGSTIDRSDRIFANERRVRFTEMEYGVPREHGPEAARRVIERVRANRYPVSFPIEMRVPPPTTPCSAPRTSATPPTSPSTSTAGWSGGPTSRRSRRSWTAYGGRPHWGKRHFQTAATLAPRYPRWAEFQRAATSSIRSGLQAYASGSWAAGSASEITSAGRR